MATSTCTYHDKYWEFLQERHAVWLKTLLFVSWIFVCDCFESICSGSALNIRQTQKHTQFALKAMT